MTLQAVTSRYKTSYGLTLFIMHLQTLLQVMSHKRVYLQTSHEKA